MTFCSNTSGPSTRIYIVKLVCNRIKRRRKVSRRVVFCWLELDIAWQQQTITSYCLWMFTRLFLLWTLNYLFRLISGRSVIYIDSYMYNTLHILVIRIRSISNDLLWTIMTIYRWFEYRINSSVVLTARQNLSTSFWWKEVCLQRDIWSLSLSRTKNNLSLDQTTKYLKVKLYLKMVTEI